MLQKTVINSYVIVKQRRKIATCHSHLIKIYPMTLVFLSPHGPLFAGHPVPNPMKESQLLQSFSLLPRIPILALGPPHNALNPSLLQLCCKGDCGPSSVFHMLRPSDVLRYCPSAISEYRESASWFMTIKFVVSSPGIFMPRQIWRKVCSSRSGAWSLLCQNQFFLLQG